MGLPDLYWANYIYYPSTAILFRVEEIYLQTPGPGAGERLEF